MDSSLTDSSHLSAEGRQEGGGGSGGRGHPCVGTRQVHSGSRWAALSGTALRAVPSALLPASATLMYKPATFPLSGPWRARQELPEPKWQRPPPHPLPPPTLSLQLARSPLQPAWRSTLKKGPSGAVRPPARPMPLGGGFSGGHFIYSSPQAPGGKTIWAVLRKLIMLALAVGARP